MAGSNQPKTELEKLKAKYIARAEEFDQEEEALKRQIELLQRMLVRVSLAADGQSDALDAELDSLRSLLRKEDVSAKALSSRLDKIESCVLKLDESRSGTSEKLLESLEILASQLSELNISRASKKLLKGYSRQLKFQVESLQDTPALLGEYASIQRHVLHELFGLSETPQNSGGFFQKLFGNNTKAETPSSTNQSTLPDADFDDADEIDERPYTELETELAVEGEIMDDRDDATEIDDAPGFSKIAGHVGSSLRNLLEQLIIPDNALREAERLRQKIEVGLNWYELGPTLDDVANLVIAAISKGQRDFEGFLQTLDDRLKRFEGFLVQAASHQSERRGAGQQLNDSIQGELQTLTDDVNNATDIDHLKQSVTGHLDSILGTLSNFMAVEEGREQILKEQLEEAREKMQELETESKNIKQKLQEERGRALTDTLTQLPNREAYMERFDFEFTRWQRYGQPVTMVVADIDHFKQVNDNYGHLAGDKVIQIMGKELQRRIRKTDFVARIGGEEFVILMPETNLQQAQPVMEKAREMVQKLPFHFRKERVQITMSFGIAEFMEGATKDEIFDAADKALYSAKQQGRNRVVVHDSDNPNGAE